MVKIAAVLNWRPKTPFYYGWLVLATSFLTTFPATGVSQAVIGGVQSFIIEDTGWKRSQLAAAVTAGTWASALLTPFVGRLADRYSARWLMPVGSVIAGIALFWVGGSVTVWHFLIALILGRAVSNPVLIGVVPRTLAVNFFRRHRNIALALVSEARPLSAAVVIQIVALIATVWGWRAAYQYLGLMSLAMVLPLIIIMRRRPEDIGLLPDGARPGEVGSAAAQGERHGRSRWLSSISGETEFDWKVGEALRTRAFWFTATAAFLSIVAASSVSFSLVPYMVEEAGLSISQATWVFSFGTFLTIANLGWAFLANRFTPRVCLAGVMIAGSVMILFLFTVKLVSPAFALPMAFIYALLWGLAHGPVGTMEHMMLAQYFGRASYGSIIGVLGALQSGALGLGPIFSALAYDLTGNYGILFLALMGTHLVGAVLIFLIRPPTLPARATARVAGRTE
jgi:MFS family permease